MENLTTSVSYDEIQKRLLKMMINQPSIIPDVIFEVTEDDFGNKYYKELYNSIVEIYKEKGISEITLLELKVSLNNKGIQDKEENKELYTDLPVEPITVIISALKSESARRNTINVIEKIQTELGNPKQPIKTTLELLSSASQQISRHLQKQKSSSIEDDSEDFWETITSTEPVGKIPSPYPSLDKYTGGWGDGDLITISAKTSVGKSVCAVNCATTAMLSGKSVIYFSLEMSKDQLLQRIVANVSNIEMNKIYPRLRPECANEVQKAIETIKNSKLHIDDESSVSVDYIYSACEDAINSDKGLDMIIIDYLQLMDAPASYGSNRQEKVSELSRQMKLLAKHYNIPVIIVAQYKRDNEKSDGSLPTREGIRESGAIANDSDIILLIDRNVSDQSPMPKATFILDKNRDGPAGKIVTMHSLLSKALFIDPTVLKSEELLNDFFTDDEEGTDSKSTVLSTSNEEIIDVDMDSLMSTGENEFVPDENFSIF